MRERLQCAVTVCACEKMRGWQVGWGEVGGGFSAVSVSA